MGLHGVVQAYSGFRVDLKGLPGCVRDLVGL